MDDALLQQLRQHQDQLLSLQNAIDTVGIGYWRWAHGEAMKWDGNMLILFGIRRSEVPGNLEEFLLLLDDPSQIRAIDALDGARAKSGPIDLTLRIEKTGELVRFTGRPHLVPGTSEQVISGLCQRIDEAGIKAQEDANTELANFASVASHDLREPLRMISSYLRLLQERSPEALDDRARRYIDYACEGADRMRQLIEDLLSYARLDNETLPPSPLALEDIMSETIGNLTTMIRETGAEVTVEIDNAPIVLGNTTSLVRLFQNLISNAIKFHPTGATPRVHVSFRDEDTPGTGDYWVVSIQDQGIGIDEEHHRLIFSLFQRLNTRDEFEGSGIGLAVCKKIVQRLNGKLSFESEKGKGSTFYVSLLKADPNKLGA